MIATLDLRCAGCGAVVSAAAPYPYRCPNAESGDGRDHVLGEADEAAARRAPPDPSSPQPFVRYRARLWSHALALAGGMRDRDFVARVEALDAAVAAVDGRGFRVTPFAHADRLAAGLGLAPGGLWIKDETGNVAGSHKGRHLFGIALALEVAERTGLASRAESDRRGLAIASCGNAALAAAVVARAAARPLRVFIPEDADPRVVARLHALEAAVVICRREAGVPGDPCLHAFHAAVKQGALPFCAQGSENGLTLEGGRTLGWEIADALHERGLALDRLLVQVGGGALAAATAQGLGDAAHAGAITRMPRLHPVQTRGGAPLRRAWERLRDRVLGPGAGADEAAAATLLAVSREARERAFAHALAHRAEYMWPWETPPVSEAHGILDDETYDWAALLRSTIESGGWPVVASEANVREAHRRAREATDIRADATGTAGLAGLLELEESGAFDAEDRVALLFTGVDR